MDPVSTRAVPGAILEPDRRRDATPGSLRCQTDRYFDCLRSGDGQAALQVVEDAIAGGLRPEVIQSLIVAPALGRIGDLWEKGLVSVADEHLATSICHRVLVRIFEALRSDVRPGPRRERVLLAAVEGQHHVLGLRMVADVLEAAGFDLLYLGADVPVAELRPFIAEHEPAVVGLAYGISTNPGVLAASLLAVHEASPMTRVMLGGPAVPPQLRACVYPYVTSSIEVVETVERLLAGPRHRAPAVLHELASSVESGALPQGKDQRPGALSQMFAKEAELSVDVAREQLRRAEGYREMAFRDPLTELPNRRAFEDKLMSIRVDQTAAALLMIDVDYFKAINDRLGHDGGDQVLRAIGRAIGSALRREDFAARVGGDEFALLLPGATVESARVVADRVRDAVAAQTETDLSISVGIASLSTDTRRALLGADEALYAAKNAGRDRVAVAGE